MRQPELNPKSCHHSQVSLILEIAQFTVKVTLSAKGLGILCAGKPTSNWEMDASKMKLVVFMPLDDDPDVNG